MKKCLAVIVFLFVLTGCSSQQKVKLNKNNPTTVMIWHYYSGEQKKAFDNLISEFNYSYGRENGIIVESMTTSDVSKLINELKSSFDNEPGSQPLPDAFFTYSDSAYPLAKAGYLSSYDYITEKELDSYIDGFINEGRFLTDGKLYIMPVAKATEVIMLNKTDFDAFLKENKEYSRDDLATWEGVSDLSEAYYKWSGGKAFFGIDVPANFIISSSKQNGVNVFDNVDGEGHINIDKTSMRKIWEIYYLNMVKGHFGAYNNFRSDDVKTGELVSYLGSTSSGAYFPSIVNKGSGNEYRVEMEAFSMPVYKGGDPVAIQQGAGIAIIKTLPEKEYAVTQFIKWFTEPERNTEFALASSYLPVTKEAIESLRNDAGIIGKYVSNEAVLKVLKAAVSQIDAGYNMFLTKPFETSYDARMALQNALLEYTRDARRNLINDIEGGIEYNEAIKKYTGEDNFNAFFQYMRDIADKFASYTISE